MIGLDLIIFSANFLVWTLVFFKSFFNYLLKVLKVKTSG